MANKLYEYWLPFKPTGEVEVVKNIDVRGVNVGVSIKLKTDNQHNWALFIDNDIEISSHDYFDYLGLWNKAICSGIASRSLGNVLIIGGGDHQILNYLLTHKMGRFYTLIDPLAFAIPSILEGHHNCFAYDAPNVRIVEDIFDAPKSNKALSEVINLRGKIDTIIIDVSDDSTDRTNEIYSEDFLDYIHSLRPKNIFAYTGCGSLKMDERFEMLGSYSKYIETYQADSTVQHWIIK